MQPHRDGVARVITRLALFVGVVVAISLPLIYDITSFTERQSTWRIHVKRLLRHGQNVWHVHCNEVRQVSAGQRSPEGSFGKIDVGTFPDVPIASVFPICFAAGLAGQFGIGRCARVVPLH